MKQQLAFCLTVGVVAISLTLVMLIGGPAKASRAQEKTAGPNDYKLSGPYTHENLSIFLVHGKDRLKGTFLTLQEALEQKRVIVHETKDVNELSIENRSSFDVFVQAGDIVKGGQQDRMIAVDLIVPPTSGRIPLAAFCVEQGRWGVRGGERSGSFSSSADAVATKDLKLAAKSARSQEEVWQNVTVAQEKLSANLNTTVNSTVSASSLQLAVENSAVRAGADAYVKALASIVHGKRDVIGYVFAINGKVNSADIYASNQLFQKLWPKLLNANAVEAIAELQKGPFEAATETAVKSFLTEAESGKAVEKDVTKRVQLVTREDDKHAFFETRDRAQDGVWVHRNYIRKN